jgi:riboflavin synthase
MFTGIIEQVGAVRGLTANGELKVFAIEINNAYNDTKIGDSISVNGVCLTLTRKAKNTLFFDAMAETLSKTNLGRLKHGDKVNLERSLRMDSYVSGHFVYGHIDGTREVQNIKKETGKSSIDINIEPSDRKYLVEKGSIAVDGISLTIGEVFQDKIRIFLIPHTMGNTTLMDKKAGDPVNVEFDMLAKYIAKQKQAGPVTEEFLRKTGFVE